MKTEADKARTEIIAIYRELTPEHQKALEYMIIDIFHSQESARLTNE